MFERLKRSTRKKVTATGAIRLEGTGGTLIVTSAFLGMGGDHPLFFLVLIASATRLVLRRVAAGSKRHVRGRRFFYAIDRTEDQVWMALSRATKSKAAGIITASILTAFIVLGFNLRPYDGSIGQSVFLAGLGTVAIIGYVVLWLPRIQRGAAWLVAGATASLFLLSVVSPSAQPLPTAIHNYFRSSSALADNAIAVTPWLEAVFGLGYLGILGFNLVEAWFRRSVPRIGKTELLRPVDILGRPERNGSPRGPSSTGRGRWTRHQARFLSALWAARSHAESRWRASSSERVSR